MRVELERRNDHATHSKKTALTKKGKLKMPHTSARNAKRNIRNSRTPAASTRSRKARPAQPTTAAEPPKLIEELLIRQDQNVIRAIVFEADTPNGAERYVTIPLKDAERLIEIDASPFDTFWARLEVVDKLIQVACMMPERAESHLRTIDLAMANLRDDFTALEEAICTQLPESELKRVESITKAREYLASQPGRG